MKADGARPRSCSDRGASVFQEAREMRAISPGSHRRRLLAVSLLAVATGLAERLDREVFAAGGWINGHSVKHVLAAVAAGWAVRMLRLRKPAPGASQAR